MEPLGFEMCDNEIGPVICVGTTKDCQSNPRSTAPDWYSTCWKTSARTNTGAARTSVPPTVAVDFLHVHPLNPNPTPRGRPMPAAKTNAQSQSQRVSEPYLMSNSFTSVVGSTRWVWIIARLDHESPNSSVNIS